MSGFIGRRSSALNKENSLRNARISITKNVRGNTYSVKRGCCVLLGNLIPDTTGKYGYEANVKTKLTLAENTIINRKLNELNQ